MIDFRDNPNVPFKFTDEEFMWPVEDHDVEDHDVHDLVAVALTLQMAKSLWSPTRCYIRTATSDS